LASTVRKLLERAPGSLLIVPAAAEPATGVARYARVLVPLDGSPEAELALPIAARIALAHDAELVIVHVVPAPEVTQTGPLDSEDLALVDRLRRRNERAASAYLDRARARLSEQNVAARVLLLSQNGDVGGRVAGAAVSEHADLIVAAAHGRNARRTLPCGSATAELIARRPSGPLLIVRGRQQRAMRRVVGLEPQSALRLPHHALP
jgi:nucleotide-binding universal stress UspA family protein